MMSMQPSGGMRSVVARTQRRCQKAWTHGSEVRTGGALGVLHVGAAEEDHPRPRRQGD